MNVLEQLIEQIPLRHNITSSIMLMGVIQSLFISLVIFIRSKNNYAIIYFGWSFLCSSLVFFDTYLCYTGLIKNVLFLNDSSEFLVLLIFPLVYFSIYGLIKRKPINFKTHWWHFILPFGYFITQIPFYFAPLSVKYNAYLGAYFPNLDSVKVSESFNYDYHIFKDIFDWLILLSILLYVIISFRLVKDEKVKNGIGKKTKKTTKYIFTRNSAIVLLLLLIFIFIIFYTYDDDGGDHYIAFFQVIIAFSTTYLIISESRFFEKSWIADKYETLGKPKNDLSFKAIHHYVDSKNYFLSKEASLNNLATLLKVHPNQISKVINLENQSNFNDFINQKRVGLSKARLMDSEYSHLTIEAIGNSVGFKSKSAFYNAFKKHTGTSPSSYIKSVSP